MEGKSRGGELGVVVTTRLEQATFAELAAQAAAEDRTVAAEVRRAVRFYLDQARETAEAAA